MGVGDGGAGESPQVPEVGVVGVVAEGLFCFSAQIVSGGDGDLCGVTVGVVAVVGSGGDQQGAIEVIFLVDTLGAVGEVDFSIVGGGGVIVGTGLPQQCAVCQSLLGAGDWPVKG